MSTQRGSKILSSGAGFLKKLVFEDPAPAPGEHRRELRQPVAGEVIVVELDADGTRRTSHRVFIRNLSRSGCGLWCRARLTSGSMIDIVFRGANDEPVTRRATVAHCRGQDHTGFAVGVRFAAEPGAAKNVA